MSVEARLEVDYVGGAVSFKRARLGCTASCSSHGT